MRKNEHGGDLLSYKNFFNGRLIDFSSNINPIGYPRKLKKLFLKNFYTVKSYPDIQYRALKIAIAGYLSCAADEVIVGNGAMEIIDGIVQNFKRIVICPPCFSEYEQRAHVHHKKIIYVPQVFSHDYFSLDIKKIMRALKPHSLLILTNPNNPTGTSIPKEQLEKIYVAVVKQNAFLLLDECFFEFAHLNYDSIHVFKKYNYRNVAIIRAATKFFGLPGLRLAYACAEKCFAKKFSSRQTSWSLNAFAELAGQIIFKDKAFILNSRMYIEREKNYLYRELKKFSKLKIFKPEANFILLQLYDGTAETLFEFFLREGILIRRANNFFVIKNKKFLEGEFIRLAVRTRLENQKLIVVFQKFFAFV